MILPKDTRLYQEPNTRNLDQPQVGGTSWTPGYVYRAFNYSKPRTPTLSRQWTKFSLKEPHMTNKQGDLERCRLDENTSGWALNKNDDVKYGETFHEDLEIGDDDMFRIFNSVLQDMTLLMRYLKQHKVSSHPIAACLYLITSTPGQLGGMWAFVRKVSLLPREVQGRFKPSGLLVKFKKEFCEDRRETERTHTRQAFDKLNELIAEKEYPDRSLEHKQTGLH